MDLEKNCEECGADINIPISDFNDGNIATEFEKRFPEGVKLKRALCDMFGLGYHVNNSIIIDNLIRRMER